MKKVIFIFTQLGANSFIFERINYNRIQFFKTDINYENYYDVEKLLLMSHRTIDISAIYGEILFDNFRFVSKKLLNLTEVASIFYFENPSILLNNILKNVPQNKVNSKFNYYLKYYENRLFYMNHYFSKDSLRINYDDININDKISQYLGIDINVEKNLKDEINIPNSYTKLINNIYKKYLI